MKPILIVEDETVMRESLREWLTDIGYDVKTAEEGEEALRTLAEQDFGMAILDLRLPGKDGLQVLREAKAQRPQLKGLIITAYPSVQTAVEALKEGAVDYLPKPLDLNELEKLVRDTLGPVQVEIRPKAVTEKAVAEPTAEKAKVEGFGDDEQARRVFREGLIAYADPICSEIERSVDYFRSTFGAETIKHILLSGGGALIPGIAVNLAQRLAIETEIINPFKKITCDAKILKKEAVERIGPIAAVSVGLALRKVGDK